MIPPDVDVDDIATQLKEDGVAFSNPELALDDALQDPISASLHPNHGVAVVDVHPEKIPDLRDLATQLQDKTGLDTVILQAPMRVSVVSDTYDRAAIEAAEGALPAGLDQVTLLRDFYASVDAFSVPWISVAVALFIVASLAAVAAFRRALMVGQTTGDAPSTTLSQPDSGRVA